VFVRVSDWIRLLPLFVQSVGRLPMGQLVYMARQLGNENPHMHEGRMHINSFFPPYPSEAFGRFMQAAIERKRIPYSAYFAVTDECPFHCPHCSYAGRPPGRMDTREAKRVIDQLLDIGTVTIGFTGGEPLMREDIAELVAFASGRRRLTTENTEKKIRNSKPEIRNNIETEKQSNDRNEGRVSLEQLKVSREDIDGVRRDEGLPGAATILFTTGHGLTAELGVKLKDAGLDCIMIGMESAKAGVHDVVRGVEGSYQEALRATNTAKVAGLYTAISTVGTREKFASGDIRALAELAARVGAQEFRVLEPIPTGRMAGETEAMLDKDDSRRLAEFHIDWNRRGRGPAIAAFSYLESDEMFGCGAGYHHLFVDAVGNVCPCDLTPLSFGNLLEKPLEEIWAEMGEVFGKPRCGCLMKDICKADETIGKAARLPLGRGESFGVCRKCKKETALPAIYKRLFSQQHTKDFTTD
jgi:MoaA/NifB/PqqE/SkfB family radical SAM enzyme